MILPVALLLTLLVVPLTGGRLGLLAGVPVRGGGLIAAAMLLQVAAINVFPHTLPHALLTGVHLFTYGLAALAVVWNLRAVRRLWVVALGGGMNAAAIVLNGGVMPARPEALEAAGLTEKAASGFVNSGAVADARLWMLGDVFAWPAPLPLANVFSVGDLVLVAGFALVLVAHARRVQPTA